MNKARVLIVDDEPALSTLVCMSLEETGLYEVMVENLSHQALATARRFKPHVTLLDVNMPGKDGGDVAAEIRADGELAGTPILFLTSLVSPEEAEDREPSGTGGQFLSKKAAPAVLIRTIAGVLAHAAAAKPIRLFVTDGKGSTSQEPVPTLSEPVPRHD
jgi:two-component system, OmpR family, response regulator